MAVKNSKRKVEVLDLTGDDGDESSTSRKSRRSNVPTSTQGHRFGEAEDFIPASQGFDDDLAATDIIQGSQDYDYNQYELYSATDAKIVGVRYYRGRATTGEVISVRRQPDNQYDSNAIRVCNVMGDQIGHLPRQLAAKLAKYMDEKLLVVEGVITGPKGHFECPIKLHLFGPTEPRSKERTKTQMRDDRLQFRELTESERQRKRHEKELKEQEKAAKKGTAFTGMGQGAEWEQNGRAMFANLSAPAGFSQQETFEDIISQSTNFNPRDAGQAMEKFGVDEESMSKMPMAENPNGLSTMLLPYQRQGLAWMLDRESPQLPTSGSSEVVQLWKRQGSNFMNVATNYTTTTPPPLASGGILADDMGLGKTIQIISLILADSKPKAPASSKTTLIISPLSVMSNWRDQIAAHIKAESALKVLIYHGAQKKEVKRLAEYDVVITTYGALATDYNNGSHLAKGNQRKKGLFSIHWRRVVLDEGHTVRNPKSKGALAACQLDADSRWALTGTPIVNNLKDLYSQVRFLRLTGGLEDLAVFNSAVIRTITSGDPNGRLLLQALMRTICLRRRKDMGFINLKLPPLSSHVLRVKFHPHEQEKYDAFQSEAKGVLLDYANKDNQGNTTYSHLLEVILRLRQVCNHWKLCRTRIDKLMALLDEHKVVQLTPQNTKALQDLLQIRIESQEMCAICLDTLSEPVITACAHTFDRSCIEPAIERQHKCPLCRAEIKDASGLVAPAAQLGEDSGDIEIDPEMTSSKVEAMIKILKAPGQAAGTKTVVFSQWTSFLDIVEAQLAKHGIVYTRIDGKMPSAKRDAAMTRLSADPECTVMLASLNVCSVGLNLVAANQVILSDSWWAPAIEDQAMDRVYRLGQTRETTVWRLVMEGTIEDRVLEIQQEKRELMMAAFRETGKKQQAKGASVADIQRLIK